VVFGGGTGRGHARILRQRPAARVGRRLVANVRR
jgi:hypothetical protein